MTPTRERLRTRSRLVAALLTVGFVLYAVPPVQASQAPESAPGPATADIVDSTRRGGQAVALTFDDGPDPRNTPQLLGVLREHRVKAVFCLWGDHVRQHPQLVRRIAADGHTLCNHSMHHDNMSDWSAEDIRADLLATSAAIREVVPRARIPYFRAPYGAWGDSPEVAAELGMQPLGWSVDPKDWDPPGTDELVRRLDDGITPRSVVLLHDGGGDRRQTVDAVAHIVPALKADGWHFARPARRGQGGR